MTKAIIFDLDGVLITTRFLSERFEEKYGVPVAKFLPVLRLALAKATLTSSGDSFVYWQPHLKEWGVNLNRDEFFNFWFQDEKMASKMKDLIIKLKTKDIKIFILSDNFKERTDFLEQKYPILAEATDKRYYSWQTDLLKPDPRAYRQILSENNLKPEECIYFDDEKENIESASKLGIKAFVFPGAEQTKRILEEHKIL